MSTHQDLNNPAQSAHHSLARKAWYALITFACTTLLTTFSSAYAADIDCTGTVDSLSLQMNINGTVTLSLSGGPTYVYLCNIDGSVVNGVSHEVCKAMYSTLMAAKVANKKVKIRFSGHDTCQDIPAWSYPGNLGWTQVLLD